MKSTYTTCKVSFTLSVFDGYSAHSLAMPNNQVNRTLNPKVTASAQRRLYGRKNNLAPMTNKQYPKKRLQIKISNNFGGICNTWHKGKILMSLIPNNKKKSCYRLTLQP